MRTSIGGRPQVPFPNTCSQGTIPSRMAADELIVHGAREHNLKDITVRLPRNA